ncbi:TBC1 domain family member 16-like [Littorina saxatilis]|uniref:TBC1 domain family member 16-like n=1 Tax=Littorina saxatilis TaxID=31220 RepID=UPI0038B4B080
MALSSIVKKASSLLRLGSTDTLKPPPLDGEIIYCKNNVCVHPPASLLLDSEHHPGYLTLRAHQSEGSRPTLILTWIPNATLQKNPQSIENSPNRSNSRGTTPKASPRRTPRQEYAKTDFSPSPGQKVLTEKQKSKAEHKKQNQDAWSLSSDVSTESRDEMVSPMSSTPGDDSWRSERKLSSSCKSQTDSGIGTEEPVILTGMSITLQGPQVVRKSSDTTLPALLETSNSSGESGSGDGQKNNTKPLTAANRQVRVGINVNDLNASGDDSHADNCDILTAEEQLAAMLNRPKLHSKRRSGGSVGEGGEEGAYSIHMAGDSLVVMSDGQSGTAPPNSPSPSITDKNLNTNENKFDTSTASSSQSTDNDSPMQGAESPYAVSSPNTLQASPDSSIHSTPIRTPLRQPSPHRTPVKLASKPPCLLELPGSTPPPPNTPVETPDIAVTRHRSSSSSSSSTSGPDSPPISPVTTDTEDWDAGQGVGDWSGHYSIQHQGGESPRRDSQHSGPLESPDSTCSSASASHNMTFPENSMSFSKGKAGRRSARDQVCGVFSVDLGQMRSLRLFFSDTACKAGQVVIASRESQYKILHFHNGGLDRLAEIFQEWSLFARETDKSASKSFKLMDAVMPTGGEETASKPYQQFLVVKPQLTNLDIHPEEGSFLIVTEDIWREHMNSDGTIDDELQLRKAIFFGGLDPMIRTEVWPFLLHYFPFDSTFDEREQIRNDKYIEYHNIRKMRESLRGEDKQHFVRNIQSIVEKDVVRTDRSHPYFRGQHNPNIQVLKNILLNYAASHPHSGYTQGMSDLLAPILAEMQQETEAFWCFTGLMTRTIFVSSPTDSDMDKQLDYLRELLRVMLPRFFYHLKLLGQDALEMLFAHRWILLCFKREFSEKDALRIWETCWAHYQTDYFHLFICVAIVAIYGDDVVDQRLPADDILLHFSSLALHMNGDIVLRKARGLLHQFRSKATIPCTLVGLCSQCDPGMWDSGHVPTIECIKHYNNKPCPASPGLDLCVE